LTEVAAAGRRHEAAGARVGKSARGVHSTSLASCLKKKASPPTPGVKLVLFAARGVDCESAPLWA